MSATPSWIHLLDITSLLLGLVVILLGLFLRLDEILAYLHQTANFPFRHCRLRPTPPRMLLAFVHPPGLKNRIIELEKRRKAYRTFNLLHPHLREPADVQSAKRQMRSVRDGKRRKNPPRSLDGTGRSMSLLNSTGCGNGTSSIASGFDSFPANRVVSVIEVNATITALPQFRYLLIELKGGAFAPYASKGNSGRENTGFQIFGNHI